MLMAPRQSEHRRRRRQLLEAIGPEAILILPAASEVTRNRDVHYPFRQNSDFLWLTGFPEPDALAVLAPKHKEGDYILFTRARDPERETWDGRRYGPEGARAHFQAKAAYALADIDEKLPELLASRRRLYYPFAQEDAFDRRVMHWLRAARAQTRQGISAPSELIDSGELLHEARLRKSPAELALMQAAARISAAAHSELMRACRPGMTERQLENRFVLQCAEQGGHQQAYSPIVAGGANACILHYIDNEAPLRDGDLVLIDAGCELHGYASDITRTFPVNGRFSPAQRDLYALVLQAQQAALAKAKPGATWEHLHQAALRVLTQGLKRLGFFTATDADVKHLIKDKAYQPFYMHRTGHWLGLDVHDVGAYKNNGRWRAFEPGMTLTIEPGLYVAPDADAPEPYRGIGIRIEDDILITADGHQVLSAAVPKHIEQIEALMATARQKVPTRRRGAKIV